MSGSAACLQLLDNLDQGGDGFIAIALPLTLCCLLLGAVGAGRLECCPGGDDGSADSASAAEVSVSDQCIPGARVTPVGVAHCEPASGGKAATSVGVVVAEPVRSLPPPAHAQRLSIRH